ncbi:DUF1806 family protein [Aquibacillus salsiterrae]|uniref:DUF1806 family protein n=1 Tax=Aquibacillus salsiterrae TaxID=2950439 RepID=A0A9X3WFB4_9BACI|nr:DUF1806 family protein [Aquibacillus salsiterrae]MDC3417618.1 DUF1806 family protein [Aquibacillus salsiterrae]
MEELRPDRLLNKLNQWKGRPIYIHMEINPGGYFRNGKAMLDEVHVKGDTAYRVFLELDQKSSLIHVDYVTHMQVLDDLVVVTGYDEHGRLARTLEISTQPFPL